jgi:hypothetical protein
MLLSLLFVDQAFASVRVTSPEILFSLRMPDGLNRLSLHIKDSYANRPIFQGIRQDAYGTDMADGKAMSAGTLRTCFANWGRQTGFELPLKPYVSPRQ